jgi:FAD/FMN-containing dehydrogenase
VVGLEAVAGTGDVIAANLAGLLKDNTGYDLAGLICGSEGTLAIVTRVRLRLVPRPAARAVALLAFDSLGAAVGALRALRSVAAVRAVEVMRQEDIAIVATHLGRPFPLHPVPPVVLLVEVSGDESLDGALAGVVATAAADVVAADPSGVAELWRWREGHPEAIAAMGVVHKADVTLPPTALASFVASVDEITSAAGATTTFVYGHLGDGNLHVNLVGPAPEDDTAVDAVLDLVLRSGGSISAEHGIGRAKRAWLVRQRGAAAVELMRATKVAWDPDGILNPGVLLP